MAKEKPKGNDDKPKKIVRSRPRDPATRQAIKRAFCEAYAECGSIHHSCKAAGISRDTFNRWRKKDAAFARRVHAAYAVSGEILEYSAHVRARGYPAKYDAKGNRIRAEHKGDTVLTIFLLKGRYPERYAERYKHDHKGSVSFRDFLLSHEGKEAKDAARVPTDHKAGPSPLPNGHFRH